MQKLIYLSFWIFVFTIFNSCSTKNPETNKNSKFKQSYFKLTTSNGLIVSVFNEKNNVIDYAYPHIFAQIDSAHYVYPFVGNIKLNIEEKPLKTSYLQNTHVITSEYKDFTVYYAASFVNEDKVLYAVIRGDENKIKNLSFNAETTPGSPVSGIDHIENPFESLPVHITGNTIIGTHKKQYRDNLYEKYFLYSFTDSLHTDKEIVNKAIEKLKNTESSLIDEEVKFMRAKIESCKIPSELSAKERNAVEQAISIFKMAQVGDKEIFPHSHGQVLASLRPGLWHVAWVRDGAFTISAMARLGMHEEARKALEFMLKAPANRYRDYVHTDGIMYGPGMDYQISLTRYFGNGVEECDYNEHGPNIEYDDWGLFLTCFTDYVERSNDWDFYNKWNDVVTKKVADVIIHCIEKNNLIKADSGPWEHHLNKTRQYIFTSGVCARGLELFAETQKKQNLPYEKYQEAAEKIRQGIINNMLVDNKYFKGNATDKEVTDHEYWDGGSFEIFANGLIKNKDLFKSHIDEYQKILGIKGDRPGYIRLESSDAYENQEWVFIDMRIAYAHLLLGSKKTAYEIISHITNLAAVNNNTISEMISNKEQMKKVSPEAHAPMEVWCNCIRPESDMLIGMIPMVGYGSGAYVLSLLSYYGY